MAAVRARLAALHAYVLPEFVLLAIEEGSSEYLKWVGEQTRPL